MRYRSLCVIKLRPIKELSFFMFAALVCLLFSSCEPKPKQIQPISIYDLKIPDPEREGILKMHVTHVAGFDTNYQYMFEHPDFDIDKPYVKVKWSRFTQNYPLAELVKHGDDREYYDSFGNHIFSKLHLDHSCGYYPANIYFQYTPNGLLLKAWGGHEPDSVVHQWDEMGNRLVSIHWLRIRRGSGETDTCVKGDSVFSYFDDSLRLILLVTKSSWQLAYDAFQYDSRGKLIKQKHIVNIVLSRKKLSLINTSKEC